MCTGLRQDPQNKTERNKAAAEEQRPDYEKYTGKVDGTPVRQPVGSKVTLGLAPEPWSSSRKMHDAYLLKKACIGWSFLSCNMGVSITERGLDR